MAVYANISIDQGSTFNSIVTVENANGDLYNLTDYSARAQLRKTYTSLTSYEFDADITSPEQGEITLKMASESTSLLKAGRYLYDIEIVNDETLEVTRVVEGQVEVHPRVTRPYVSDGGLSDE